MPEFLNPKYENLTNPYELPDLEKAVKRIEKAVKNNVAKQDRWKYVVGYGLGGAVVGGVIGGFVGYGVGFLCGATSTSGVALKAISKALSSKMVQLAYGVDINKANKMVDDVLTDGRAYQKFLEIIKAAGLLFFKIKFQEPINSL